MSPITLGRRCAAVAVLLVLTVAATPATAQTHASTIQTHA
jgi:hypothetical protein